MTQPAPICRTRKLPEPAGLMHPTSGSSPTGAVREGISHLPANPEVVATFISSEAATGIRPSTIGRRLAAIRYAHRLAGEPTPTDAELVGVTMRGIRRTVGSAKVKKAPATAPRINDMLQHIPDSLTGKRDRALLLLGFAAALRRSELVALQVSDLELSADGARVLIRRSKTDKEGHGRTVGIRPAGALAWWKPSRPG